MSAGVEAPAARRKSAKVGNARWLMPAALSASVMVAYLDRLNVSLALPAIARDFGWSTAEVGSHGGLLLGVFFLGYGLSNIFLSPLAGRFGPRRSLMTIVVLFSLFTALGAPLGAYLAAFVATRLLLGVSEGVHFPMMSTLTKAWFPAHERSRANALWVGGVLLATALGPILLIPIVERIGWREMLVVCGALGLVVTLPLIYLFVHDTPRSSPRVSPAEAEYIEAGSEPDEPEGGGLGFLRRPAFRLALLAGILNNFCVFGLLQWLPTYFEAGRGLPFSGLAYAVSLPYAAGIVGIAAMAWLGDKSGRRSLLAGAGVLLAAACVFGAATAPGIGLTVALFAAAVFFQSAYSAQEYAIVGRILPRSSVAKGSGVYNGVAVLLGGVGGSVAVGAVVSATGSYAAGLMTIVGAALFMSLTLFALSRRMSY